MKETPEPKPTGIWKIAGREGGCYCDLWDKDPATYEKKGFLPGFCGICERCGKPGHTRHFPGPVPYTGAWCDKCYLVLKWTWPFRSVMGWFYLFMIFSIVWFIAQPVIAAIKWALG